MKKGQIMSKLSAKVAVPAAILTLVGGIVLTKASLASAHLGGDGPTTLIQKLVEKFNLNEDEVKAVFEEVRVQQHAEMQAKHHMMLEEKLSEAVSNGEITDAQKQLILDKHDEMMAEREAMMESWKDLSEEEREAKKDEHKSEMEAKHAEMEAWAESNGINLKLLTGFGGPGKHLMMRADHL